MYRAILLDWITEVCHDYLFKRDTCYLAFEIIDKYLVTIPNIDLEKFQLVGIAAIFLAAKLEEVYTPRIEMMVECCNGTYTAEQIIDTEFEMMFAFDF